LARITVSRIQPRFAPGAIQIFVGTERNASPATQLTRSRIPGCPVVQVRLLDHAEAVCGVIHPRFLFGRFGASPSLGIRQMSVGGTAMTGWIEI